MRLNVGCGNHYADGWVNVDIDAGGDVRTDVQGDITGTLPFNDGSAERIYLGHVLEHVDLDDVPPALAECRRLLGHGGVMCIVGPDCDRADAMLAAGQLDDVEHGLVVEGAGRWAHDVHLWRSTETAVTAMLEADGWTVLPVTLDELARSTWPLVSGVAWQFSVIALPGGDR